MRAAMFAAKRRKRHARRVRSPDSRARSQAPLTNEATEIIFLTFFDRLEILRSRPLCDSAPAL